MPRSILVARGVSAVSSLKACCLRFPDAIAPPAAGSLGSPPKVRQFCPKCYNSGAPTVVSRWGSTSLEGGLVERKGGWFSAGLKKIDGTLVALTVGHGITQLVPRHPLCDSAVSRERPRPHLQPGGDAHGVEQFYQLLRQPARMHGLRHGGKDRACAGHRRGPHGPALLLPRVQRQLLTVS